MAERCVRDTLLGHQCGRKTNKPSRDCGRHGPRDLHAGDTAANGLTGTNLVSEEQAPCAESLVCLWCGGEVTEAGEHDTAWCNECGGDTAAVPPDHCGHVECCKVDASCNRPCGTFCCFGPNGHLGHAALARTLHAMHRAYSDEALTHGKLISSREEIADTYAEWCLTEDACANGLEAMAQVSHQRVKMVPAVRALLDGTDQPLSYSTLNAHPSHTSERTGG